MDEELDKEPPKICSLPTLEDYDKSYGRSMDGNDQKAVVVFKTYETKEKVRRLQAELQWIKGGKVPADICDRIIGKKRQSKYRGYEHWAELMLLWLVAKRQ